MSGDINEAEEHTDRERWMETDISHYKYTFLNCFMASLSHRMGPTLCFSSVIGPQGLRLVQVSDVSLLVEWESVPGAEYYVLTYHPKYDENAMETVCFFCFFFSILARTF